MFDLTVIGDTVEDNFLLIDEQEASLHAHSKVSSQELCFTYGKKIPIRKIEQSLGGNAYNVALGAQRLGLKVDLITTLGTNSKAKEVLTTLKSNHINTSQVHFDDNANDNHSTILVYKGERTILTYHRAVKYNFSQVEIAQWLYLTSMGKGSEKFYGDLLQQLQKGPINLIFQPGTHQLKLGHETLKPFLKQTKIFIANKQEYQALFEQNNLEKELDLLNFARQSGPEIVLLTNGIKGSHLLVGNDYYFIPAWLGRKVIEPTGAGDAFASTFVSARIQGQSVENSLIWAVVNSGHVVEYLGATAGLLSQSEIRHFLKNPDIPQVKKEPQL